MELAKNEIINKLPKYQAELVALRVGHKEIKNLNEIEIKKECNKIISRAFIYSSPNGQVDNQILSVQTIELYNCVKKYFTMTLPELHFAFKEGLDGLTGPWFGLCGKTYNQFLKGFFEKPERGKAFSAYLDLSDKPSVTDKPMHKIIDESNQAILNRFKRYKRIGDIENHAFAVYDLLCEKNGVEFQHHVKGVVKTLVPDKNVRSELFQKTKSEYEKHLNKHIEIAKFRLDKEKVTVLQHLLKNYTTDRVFEHKLKESYLKWYFDSIEELEIKNT